MFARITRCKPVFLGMAILTSLMAFPCDQIFAGIIATEASIAAVAAGQLKARILSLLAREDVRSALLQHGITPSEAEARVNALTDEEVVRIFGSAQGMVSGGNRNVKNDNQRYAQLELFMYLGLFAAALLLWGCLWLTRKLLDWPKPPWPARNYASEMESPSKPGQTELVAPAGQPK